LPPFPESWSLLGRFYGLEPGSIIAVRLDLGITVHRLIRGDAADESDFVPIRQSRAEKQGIPELERTGLSHFMTIEQAREGMWRSDQTVGRFSIGPHPRVFLARTDRHNPGHLDIWMPADVIEQVLGAIEIVE
jgi:hypothetical protein